jgi:V8-like Glu-specific endopeptidase
MVSILLTFLLLAFVSADPPTSGALQPDGGKKDDKGNGRTRDGGPPEWANRGVNGRKRGKATFGFIDPTPQLPPGWQNGHKKDPAVVGGPPDERVMVGPDVNGDLWEIEITDEAVGHARAALGLGNQDNSIDGKHNGGALLETGYFFNQAPASNRLDESVWPNNLVGYLSMGCTGTQIGYRVVATAAHCVYDTVNNVWGNVANTKWYPGLRTQMANHPAAQTFSAYQFWASNAYISWSAYNPQYDWGAVILQTPNNVGYLGFSWRPTLPATVTHQGYPNNKFPYQWGDSCSPSGDNQITFNHYCDINPGSSGGPMFEAGPKVLGTQSGHYADGSGPNIAEKYNQDAFNNLLSYRNTFT